MDGEDSGNGDWTTWRNHVLAEIKRISENVEKLAASDLKMRVEIGKLKLASAIWGSIAGAFGALGIMLIYTFLTGG